MRKIITHFSAALLLALISASCVTFSTNQSPSKNIDQLAAHQLSIAMYGPMTAVNQGIAGADSTKFRTPGTTVDVTIEDNDLIALRMNEIYNQYLKVTCVDRNSWIVLPDTQKTGTVNDNISFINEIVLTDNGIYECSFTGIENDQNGLTADFGSKGVIKVKILPGAECRIIQNVNNNGAGHKPDATAEGSAEFTYYYNSKPLDWCRALFSESGLTITTSQDSK